MYLGLNFQTYLLYRQGRQTSGVHVHPCFFCPAPKFASIQGPNVREFCYFVEVPKGFQPQNLTVRSQFHGKNLPDIPMAPLFKKNC